jgi:hypothetical protein
MEFQRLDAARRAAERQSVITFLTFMLSMIAAATLGAKDPPWVTITLLVVIALMAAYSIVANSFDSPPVASPPDDWSEALNPTPQYPPEPPWATQRPVRWYGRAVERRPKNTFCRRRPTERRKAPRLITRELSYVSWQKCRSRIG